MHVLPYTAATKTELINFAKGPLLPLKVYGRAFVFWEVYGLFITIYFAQWRVSQGSKNWKSSR
jgi:hypothetical protein